MFRAGAISTAGDLSGVCATRNEPLRIALCIRRRIRESRRKKAREKEREI